MASLALGVSKAMTEIAAELEQAIEQAANQYFRLVLLVRLGLARPQPYKLWRRSSATRW